MGSGLGLGLARLGEPRRVAVEAVQQQGGEYDGVVARREVAVGQKGAARLPPVRVGRHMAAVHVDTDVDLVRARLRAKAGARVIVWVRSEGEGEGEGEGER